MSIPFHHNLKFSIITVVYNGFQELKNTINSVLVQTYDNIEYIIIDGGSTDGTIDVIRAYSDYIDYWISESDNGIYDAMNKGVKYATGDYVVFMNAGDCFFNENTLSEVYEFISKNAVDLYAGSSNVLYSNGVVKEKKTENIRSDCYYTPVCHQSLYAKVELMRRMPFDFANYKIAADFDFMMKVAKTNGRSFVTNVPLSIVTANGISDLSRIQVWREYESIYFKYNKFVLYDWLYYKRKIVIQYIKMKVKLFIKK
ncbi:glycosyltransferase family 2 protein [Aeromonas veronii]|uniref:glycosyltransferase family 2 protein n=1 Tax=Aeromonas veronii TaxID=654 RepID=UPI00214D8859|nr:glycosyltransferase family 2 protein [Aeromonas veronii]MCR3969142.1 glycosyltransferase [Aeromonas veronii]MCR3981621.1 glycosyltransferase [Aeromonas veronii]